MQAEIALLDALGQFRKQGDASGILAQQSSLYTVISCGAGVLLPSYYPMPKDAEC